MAGCNALYCWPPPPAASRCNFTLRPCPPLPSSVSEWPRLGARPLRPADPVCGAQRQDGTRARAPLNNKAACAGMPWGATSRVAPPRGLQTRDVHAHLCGERGSAAAFAKACLRLRALLLSNTASIRVGKLLATLPRAFHRPRPFNCPAALHTCFLSLHPRLINPVQAPLTYQSAHCSRTLQLLLLIPAPWNASVL